MDFFVRTIMICSVIAPNIIANCIFIALYYCGVGVMTLDRKTIKQSLVVINSILLVNVAILYIFPLWTCNYWVFGFYMACNFAIAAIAFYVLSGPHEKKKFAHILFAIIIIWFYRVLTNLAIYGLFESYVVPFITFETQHQTIITALEWTANNLFDITVLATIFGLYNVSGHRLLFIKSKVWLRIVEGCIIVFCWVIYISFLNVYIISDMCSLEDKLLWGLCYTVMILTIVYLVIIGFFVVILKDAQSNAAAKRIYSEEMDVLIGAIETHLDASQKTVIAPALNDMRELFDKLQDGG